MLTSRCFVGLLVRPPRERFGSPPVRNRSRMNLYGTTFNVFPKFMLQRWSQDFIFTIVPEGKHVNEVYLSPETGLLAGNTSGKIFIDCSTIDIETSIAVGEAVKMSNPTNPPSFFDCPVSGGTAGAAKGIITFMCGIAADDENFELIHAILKTMGKSINPMGGRGLGLAAKLSNNYLSGIIALATSEAMNLGMKLGIDAKVLSDCLAQGSAANWVNSTVNPVPGVCPDAVTSKGYEGGFKVQLMEKDMKLAAKAAQNPRILDTGVKTLESSTSGSLVKPQGVAMLDTTQSSL
ncbi:3-hydroxyisobutyrate dehydrogenase [Mycena sanguinolenta]|nr:3-hydroxyisobutyrate dehydrogenase [Mycena sanguinolenta]